MTDTDPSPSDIVLVPSLGVSREQLHPAIALELEKNRKRAERFNVAVVQPKALAVLGEEEAKRVALTERYHSGFVTGFNPLSEVRRYRWDHYSQTVPTHLVSTTWLCSCSGSCARS